MNGRAAKAIRKAVGFHPADARRYRVTTYMNGRTGTIVSTGKRADYKAVKEVSRG